MKNCLIITSQGWFSEAQLFFSKGRRCLSYMTSWNESEKKFFTFEEARDIRSLLDRPARIEVC
ncbi:hypothetical protein [Faecalibaculum rodentium]|jgi:hypothetical protein|uniref:Uncharacterized protein n=1 Tax=Faecalibaculum rodentium TaxID=1702221 RepID=A0A140DTJ3_9FIRM|nr:hypothetical protein [Faecalibaculum rodentium]AMK53970.1 hypothetical protein AALO17_08360 [Faecalibaculum rodentium]OLU44315.1 hypothetical protein BO223_08605 [Faecalibaculum rodentium]